MVSFRQLLSGLGNGVSLLLLVTPLWKFWRIFKRGSLEENFSPFPYLATLLNCTAWVVYELPTIKGNTLILIFNSVGIFLELLYVSIAFSFSIGRQKVLIAVIFGIELVSTAGLLGVLLAGVQSHEQRMQIGGSICVVTGILMYGSTTPALVKSWNNRSVDSLPLPLVIIGLANTTIWMTYALLYYDIFMLIQNACGLFLCAIQLGVYLIIIKCRHISHPPTPNS